MNLDRGLIKRQARELIKGKWPTLFVVWFIVSFCVSIFSGANAAVTVARNPIKSFDDLYSDDYNYDNSDEDYFDEFEFSDEASDFNNFGTAAGSEAAIKPVDKYVIGDDLNNYTFSIGSNVVTFLTLILAPLEVTLAAFFVQFIRGKEMELGDGLKFVFKGSFDKTYGKKFVLNLLIAIFTALWSMLFVVPGIVYAYSVRFAPQIMCDNPNLSPMDAIKLSKKMTKGNRGELFVLDLSFIPWMFLCAFVFPMVYVMPYIQVTEALYYENFRLRAIQQGRVTEDDFLSDEEKYHKYQAEGFAQNTNNFYAPNGAASVASQNAYYNPANPVTEAVNEAPAEEAPIAPEAPAYEPPTYDAPIAEETKTEEEIPTVEAENVTDEFED